MKNFGGGEGEPDESVGDDENAERAPDDQAHTIKWRRSFGIGGVEGSVAREFAGPAIPEAAETVGDFCGRKQNHQSDAEDSGANQVLNEGITHCARI